MMEEIAGAKSHVHIAGWFFTPHFALTRDGEPAILRDLLAELAERVEVRVLVWAGAPLPLFRPSRRTVRKMRERLVSGTRIQCALDSKERPMHCHHEKTIVVDDRVAFVGGIDLTSESGDRFDTSDHPARGRARLARRERADRGAGGRRRRGALPAALAGGDRGGARADCAGGARRRGRAADRAHGAGTRVRGAAEGRLQPASSQSWARVCGRRSG